MELFSGFLFKGLSEEQIQRIASAVSEMAMRKDQYLCSEYEEGNRFYILKDGAVELLSRVDEQVELPITLLKTPGDILGASCLVEPYQYNLSARCAETGSVLCIERGDLEKLLNQDQGMGNILMGNLAAQLLGRLRESRQELKIHFRTLLKSFRA
ncbi:MAG: hypothetical protein DRH12_17490 [Deltaproteobacteria bacterium]|nr:MAG: hypothetical protein DRH12_17490 [Deltaproteobacteria bacterium]